MPDKPSLTQVFLVRSLQSHRNMASLKELAVSSRSQNSWNNWRNWKFPCDCQIFLRLCCYQKLHVDKIGFHLSQSVVVLIVFSGACYKMLDDCTCLPDHTFHTCQNRTSVRLVERGSDGWMKAHLRTTIFLAFRLPRSFCVASFATITPSVLGEKSGTFPSTKRGFQGRRDMC